MKVIDLIHKLNGFCYYRVYDDITGDNITDNMLSNYEYEVTEIATANNVIMICAKRVDN